LHVRKAAPDARCLLDELDARVRLCFDHAVGDLGTGAGIEAVRPRVVARDEFPVADRVCWGPHTDAADVYRHVRASCLLVFPIGCDEIRCYQDCLRASMPRPQASQRDTEGW